MWIGWECNWSKDWWYVDPLFLHAIWPIGADKWRLKWVNVYGNHTVVWLHDGTTPHTVRREWYYLEDRNGARLPWGKYNLHLMSEEMRK